MGRPGVDTKRSKAGQLWGVHHRSGRDSALDIGQTEYITRLTALRDSLIDQEQAYLAQALDRLRIHSLSNKSSSYRLRMNGDDVSKTMSPTSHIAQTPRANMVTTVEKFRQMRPKRHPPVIFPLQGKQLLESQTQKEKDNNPQSEVQSKAGNSTNRSAKDADMSARSLPTKVDETVQANLQRLLQPTSSIPNIGRKALKKPQSFEPKTRGLLNNNGSGSGNRFITRPRVVVPKRSPTQASPDTIIAAVTNSNNIYSMNYHYSGSSSGNNSSIHNNNNHRVNGGVIYDEVCSDTDSVYGNNNNSKKSRNGHGKDSDQCESCDSNASPSFQDTGVTHFRNVPRNVPHQVRNQSQIESQKGYAGNIWGNASDTMNNSNSRNNNNNVIFIPGADEDAESGGQSYIDPKVMDVPQNIVVKSDPNQNSKPVSKGRRLYRNAVGPSDQANAGSSKQQWQNQSRSHQHDGDTRTRTFPSNHSSVSASKSTSQIGSSSVYSGYNYNSGKDVRNSIDIYLPTSHPFGTPFVRTESYLSRENTTGSEGGWSRVNTHNTYNPSVESIQPGIRFPAIHSGSGTADQQAAITISEGRRSRSSSQGEITLPASTRHQKASSLPNVRTRCSIQRRRSNSSSEGFSEEPGNRSRRNSQTRPPWARVSLSQGGSRGLGGAMGESGGEEVEDGEVAGDSSSARKRHIVVDMPSIIFNAASPDVGVENSTSTLTPAARRDMTQGQGQGQGGSTPHSRAGGQGSGSVVGTPTGWSPAASGGGPAVPNLSKAVKQQEIRKRELQNLLEDVRELNIRTEVLSSQSEGGVRGEGGGGGEVIREELFLENGEITT